MIDARQTGKLGFASLVGLMLLVLLSLTLRADELEPRCHDMFDDPESGWATTENETGTVGYRNGRYNFRIVRDSYVWRSWAPCGDVPRSFIAEATGYARPGGYFSKLGIIWGIDSDNFLIFCITPGGWFSVQVRRGGEWQAPVIDWTESRTINQGEQEQNTLRVAVDGDSVELSINRRYVGSFVMGGAADSGGLVAGVATPSLAPGQMWLVGLAAGSFHAMPVEVSFGEFALYEL